MEIKIRERTFNFAIRIVKLYKHLTETKKEYIISKQILKSGTSIGAMVREAENGESKLDFIHKLSIAQKECDETVYWLELLKATDFISEMEYLSIINEASSILKILKSINISTKSNLIKAKATKANNP